MRSHGRYIGFCKVQSYHKKLSHRKFSIFFCRHLFVCPIKWNNKNSSEERNDVTKKYVKIWRLTLNEGQVQRSKVKVKVKGQGSRSKSNIKFKIPYYYYFAKVFDFSQSILVSTVCLSACLSVCLSVTPPTGHSLAPIKIIFFIVDSAYPANVTFFFVNNSQRSRSRSPKTIKTTIWVLTFESDVVETSGWLKNVLCRKPPS